MSQSHGKESAHRPISRRTFVKLAAAGLLAGCAPTPEPTATAVPTPTLTTEPTATPVPTQRPTRAPTATPTPYLTPTPSAAFWQPEVIKVYPDVRSKVVHAHHEGVWDGESLVPGALRQMLDASITELTGLNDAREAWAALFRPDERIAIKVNAFRNSIIWTHVPLVQAVTDSLQNAGIPAEQIVVFDYYTSELEEAGYQVNVDGPGVRCYGTDRNYSSGWRVAGAGVDLSDVLLSCNTLINMPVLKSHMITGMTFALKNHYGTISNPGDLHGGRVKDGMGELNMLPPIKDRTRLVIGDVLTACLRYGGSWPYWESDWTGDSILMSFDPLAHDAVGFDMLKQLLAEDGVNTSRHENMANPWLENAAEMGLGTNDLESIDLKETNLA
jgi:hypothetical protein